MALTTTTRCVFAVFSVSSVLVHVARASSARPNNCPLGFCLLNRTEPNRPPVPSNVLSVNYTDEHGQVSALSIVADTVSLFSCFMLLVGFFAAFDFVAAGGSFSLPGVLRLFPSVRSFVHIFS